MLLSELFDMCLKEHWDQPRFQLSGHCKEVRSKYKNHIGPKFGQLDYLAITRGQVRDFHKGLGNTPVTANRCLEILSRLFTYSIEKELNTQGINPCLSVKRFSERKRRRYASEAEIKKIGLILDRLYATEPLEVTFLYTLLFTGARPRSLERARWDELQEAEDGFGVLTFEGKSTEATGDLETVLLPPHIMELIGKLTRRDDGLIFGIPLPGYLWRKIRKEAGCPDLWARDMRRTFASVGMSNDVEIGIIGELLNHHSVQTTKRYAKLSNTARVKGVTAIADKLNSILKK